MMLRSRKNALNAEVVKENALPVKRRAEQAKDDPKRRRTGLSDLSNVITSSLCIDSNKKTLGKPVAKGVLKCRNRNLTAVDEVCKTHEDVALIKETITVKEKIQLNAQAEEKQKAISYSDKNDPCPDYDYDAENIGDPFSVSEYAFDIFKYYRHRENEFVIEDYSARQQKFVKVRAVLADWLVELQELFELTHETLYTAIKIIDHYLVKSHDLVDRQSLQLMGSTAVFIASKFEERCPPAISEFVFVCEDSFTHDQVLVMERRLLKTIGFDLGYPLAYRFLRRYGKVLHLDMPTLCLARYYLETCALYYEFVGTADSLIASACLLLTLRVKNLGNWNAVLEKYSGYVLEEVEPLMWSINHAMVMRPHVYPRLIASYSKYNSVVFYEVTKFPFLEDKFNLLDPVGPPPGYSFKRLTAV